MNLNSSTCSSRVWSFLGNETLESRLRIGGEATWAKFISVVVSVRDPTPFLYHSFTCVSSWPLEPLRPYAVDPPCGFHCPAWVWGPTHDMYIFGRWKDKLARGQTEWPRKACFSGKSLFSPHLEQCAPKISARKPIEFLFQISEAENPRPGIPSRAEPDGRAIFHHLHDNGATKKCLEQSLVVQNHWHINWSKFNDISYALHNFVY